MGELNRRNQRCSKRIKGGNEYLQRKLIIKTLKNNEKAF